MRISICIPQYNRIDLLVKSLKMIEKQSYDDIEICISDDCSVDDTVEKIAELSKNYRYPIVFHRFPQNMGYDRNYRKCIEMASGDYAFVIGNDDSIYGENSIEFLVNFLNKNDKPDIGFCNMIEERTENTYVKRALTTSVLGRDAETAMKYYSCFSFVGGLIYKKSTFDKFNTDKYDGSVYAQMYLGVLIVSSGYRLFSIYEPLVLKDMLLDGKFRHSYRDRISKTWKDYRVVDGGMTSVITVLINGLKDSDQLNQSRTYHIFKRIYSLTYPHWLLDYRENKAFPMSVGLMVGMFPSKNKNFRLLSFLNRIKIYLRYFASTIIGLFAPVFLFKKFRQSIYTYFKK